MLLQVLKPLERSASPPDLSRAKISVTRNPQIDREEAKRRLTEKRRQRAETEKKLITQVYKATNFLPASLISESLTYLPFTVSLSSTPVLSALPSAQFTTRSVSVPCVPFFPPLKAAARMSFQEVRDDLTSFGLDVEDLFDRAAMNEILVDLLLSDTTRLALGMDMSQRPDEAAADRDAQAQTVTIQDSTQKSLIPRPRKKE